MHKVEENTIIGRKEIVGRQPNKDDYVNAALDKKFGLEKIAEVIDGALLEYALEEHTEDRITFEEFVQYYQSLPN